MPGMLGTAARPETSSTFDSDQPSKNGSLPTIQNQKQWRQRVVCEVEYPLMKNKAVLFVVKKKASGMFGGWGGQQQPEPQESDDWRQYDMAITELFKDAVDWKFLCIPQIDRPDCKFWRVVFSSLTACGDAMKRYQTMAKNNNPMVRGIAVYYSRPDGFQRRQTELYISEFPIDNKHEVMNMFSDKPVDVTRFAADYDPKKKDDKKLTWRITFKDEEAARASWMELKQHHELKNLYADYQPNPFTQGLIICFRTRDIPRAVFENLSLYWEGNHNSIVEEFEYATMPAELQDKHEKDKIIKQHPGDIYYDISEWEEPSQAYARLVTLNWWYTNLFYAMIYAGLALLDVYSTFIFTSGLFSKDIQESEYEKVTRNSRLWFTITFFALQSYQFYRCFLEAKADIDRIRGHAGDLIATKKYTDEFVLLCSLFVFYFVQISGMVKDIVVKLHPWTNQQEKAAIKIDGARVFLIGFANENQYRCDDQMGMHKQFPAILLSRAILTGFKAYCAMRLRSWTTFFLSLTGIVLWPIQIYYFWLLLMDRKAYSQWLVQEAQQHGLAVNDLRRIDARTPVHRGIVGNWRKHFNNFPDLEKYSLARDCTPPSFQLVLWFSVLFTLVFFGYCEAKADTPVHDWIKQNLHFTLTERSSLPTGPSAHQGSGVSLAGLNAADVDGDGHLSAWELQRALAAGNFGDAASRSAWSVQRWACAMDQADQPSAALPSTCAQGPPTAVAHASMRTRAPVEGESSSRNAEISPPPPPEALQPEVQPRSEQQSPQHHPVLFM